MKMSALVPAAEAAPLDAELSPTVTKILQGAVDAIAVHGVRRLSMSDILDASGVSRATLYRYFSNKDQVLSAVAEFVCAGFENGIREAGRGIVDPVERLRVVMQFYVGYTNENTPDRMFEVEPAFHLAFLRNRFKRYKAAVYEALEPTFEHFEKLIGAPLDRDAYCEMLVRLQLSTLIVPAEDGFCRRWDEAPAVLEQWALNLARQHV